MSKISLFYAQIVVNTKKRQFFVLILIEDTSVQIVFSKSSYCIFSEQLYLLVLSHRIRYFGITKFFDYLILGSISHEQNFTLLCSFIRAGVKMGTSIKTNFKLFPYLFSSL